MSVERIRIGSAIPADWISRKWYIATVRPGKDEAAREMLEACDIPCLMLEGRKYIRTGCKGPRRPFIYSVFSGYLFVMATDAAIDAMRFELQKRKAVNEAAMRGVRNPITGWIGGVDGHPVAVNGAVMQSVFLAHETAAFVPKSEREANRARIKMGDVVQISSGPFAFIEGIVDKFKGGNNVEILAELMGGKVCVSVPVDSLEKI